jgi:multidrug resistance efflux pump
MARLGWPALLAASVVVGAAIAGYYQYDESRYVSTDYAFVQAPTADVTAPTAGTVLRLDLPVGARLGRGALAAVVQAADGRRYGVTLPMTGTVTAAFVPAGDSVVAGQVLGEVAALRASVVVAEVPEGEARRLRVGQRADVVLPDDPSPVAGRVERIGRATAAAAAAGSGMPTLTTANATEYVPVTIRFEKGGLRVLNGMSATVRVHVG